MREEEAGKNINENSVLAKRKKNAPEISASIDPNQFVYSKSSLLSAYFGQGVAQHYQNVHAAAPTKYQPNLAHIQSYTFEILCNTCMCLRPERHNYFKGVNT